MMRENVRFRKSELKRDEIGNKVKQDVNVRSIRACVKKYMCVSMRE